MTLPALDPYLWCALGAAVIAALFGIEAILGALTDDVRRLVWGVYLGLFAAFTAFGLAWLGGWRPQ